MKVEFKKTIKLHVISFNIPLPADYGGVIGVYYHLKALHALGINIILHCFEYGREEADDLMLICDEVHYYKRDMHLVNMFSKMPFIVKTRQHPLLLKRLLEDEHPILFEGTHVCHYLSHPLLKSRNKIVRMHNVEWQYYHNMIPLEKDFKKKMFFKWEAHKLKKFELNTVKKHADAILAVSPKESSYFKEQGFGNVFYVSAFHPNEQVDILLGKGNYVLFHGDLSVQENESIALELIRDVFTAIPHVPLIIAGRRPSHELIKAVAGLGNVEMKNDVTNEEMEALIKNAQINLLRAYQPAGMKLKLLNALYKGRVVMVNAAMVKNTGLDELCVITEDIKDVPLSIQKWMSEDINPRAIENRKLRLNKQFSNIEKAKITLSLL